MNPDEIEKLKHCFVYNSMENIRNLEVIKAMADIIRICAGEGVELDCLKKNFVTTSYFPPLQKLSWKCE